MKLEDVDLTSSEYFSRRGGGPVTGAASPRHILSAHPGPVILSHRANTVHPRSCRPTFKDPFGYTLSGTETRMLEKEQVPLIMSGNKEEMEQKEFLFNAVDHTICDCCGGHIQRMPRQIVEQVGGLCPHCTMMMDSLFGAMAIQGPWTILYGPESRVNSDKEMIPDEE